LSSSDLLFLLREDLTRSFRLRNAKGKRTEKRGLLKRVLKFSIPVIVGGVILWGVLAIAPMFWDLIESFISENLGMGAAIFNAVLLFSFVGSIMISVTTVGSTSKMEYLLITPIKMRTIFLEKTIIVIFYNSII
jgi:uridylate kinase